MHSPPISAPIPRPAASLMSVYAVARISAWLTGLCLLCPAHAADWPRWRGPHSNGVVAATPLRVDWPAEGPPIPWRAEVGTGFSSLAIADGRLYTLGNAADVETLFCLDALTGDVIWKQSHPEPLDPNLFEGGPTSTPTVDAGDVFTFSRRGLAQCFDAATGEVRWRVDVPAVCEVNVPTWGFAASPVLVDGRVLLNAGQSGVALDRKTGAPLWNSGNEDDAGYATPVLREKEGEWTALILSAKALHAVDPATGTERWDYRWLTRYGVNAADPLVAGDDLWLSSGYAKGTALLHLSADDAAPTEVYRTRELRNQLSPGVLIDEHVYAVDGDAGDECELKCVDLAAGEVRWTEAALGSATLIAVGKQLLVLSEEGELIIAPATADGFQPIARAGILTGKCWTPPAFANGRLYCRNAAGTVVCVDLRR